MISREEISLSGSALQSSRQRLEHMGGLMGVIGVVFVAALSIPAAIAGTALASGVARYFVSAGVLAVLFTPVVFGFVYVAMKQQATLDQTMERLEQQLINALDQSEREAGRHARQVRRQEFETRLANALEMAEGETEVVDVVERAFASRLPNSPTELLLADNSHAHLTRVAVSSPSGIPPMCAVDSPDQCPAARRAQTQRFLDSDALDACPKLRGREQGPCAAVCVPVSIMGRTVGVIHATAEVGDPFTETAEQDLATLASLSGARIGLLRMMTDSQLQASTDSLTGLLNRRSLENKVRILREARTPMAVVMADLDHFKDLNDTHGHETGDRALRLFAETLKSSLRSHDLVSRHGGEEFAVVLPRCTPREAEAALHIVQENLKSSLGAAGLPAFTASFGIIEARDGEDLAHSITRADAALFQAKHDGRDQIVVHDEAIHTAIAETQTPRTRTQTPPHTLPQDPQAS